MAYTTNDLFVMLVIMALIAFSLVLGLVSLTDRDPQDETRPAE